MYICNCRGVNEKAVKHEAQRCKDSALESLKKNCGLGKACGQCIRHAKEVIEAN